MYDNTHFEVLYINNNNNIILSTRVHRDLARLSYSPFYALHAVFMPSKIVTFRRT